jgi:uncharacterized membrane protein YgdD (TMEM256/DUF423 family)
MTSVEALQRQGSGQVEDRTCGAVEAARPGALRPASRLWLFIGALNGLVAVAAGAYGRHGALDPAGREMFGIASQYQITHGLALLAVAWLASRHEGGRPTASNLAGAAFTLGILLFSGSLYWFGLSGLVPVRGAAPTGGFLLMFGWLALMWSGLRHRPGGNSSSV